ncbi:MAG: hypothetical protein GXP30_13750 [Verrucomicrobia bacterium]|nr:hypothetical protein [Verrucomicrobiota bacterium]
MPATLTPPKATDVSFNESANKPRENWTPGQPQSRPASEPLNSETKTSPSGFFRVSSHGIESELDEQCVGIISEKLKILREGSEAIGVELEMDSVGYVAIYTEDATFAYRFDPESDPRRAPRLIGAFLDQRVPMGALLKDLVNSTH